MPHRIFKLSVFTLAIVGLLTLVLPGAEEAKPAGPDEEIARLKKQIEKLEERVSELETKWKFPIIPQYHLPHSRPLPDGWQQKEFNGAPVYIVPLDTTGKESKSR